MAASKITNRLTLIDMHAAADMFGCSPRTVRRKIADGELTGFKVGPRMLRVDPHEVEALITASTVPTARNAG